jgi:ankyrin repeat protein
VGEPNEAFFENGVRDFVDDSGRSALDVASSGGFLNIVQLILEHDADMSLATQALGSAVNGRYIDVAQKLIEYGADVNACISGYTALAMVAGQSGSDVDLIRLLLDCGADVDLHYGGKVGNTLRRAAQRNDEDLSAVLIAYGADVNLASGDPELSPLETWCRNCSVEVLKTLLKHDAMSPTYGIMFSGPFMKNWARNRRTSNAAKVLTLLNQYSVKMDIEGDGTNLPALFEAASRGNLLVLNALLKLGANVAVWAGEHGNIQHAAVSRGAPLYFYYYPGVYEHTACVGTLLDH